MVSVFTANRSISLASSFAPAASPRLRRRPSPWPPRRHAKPATESATRLDGHALHPGPYPPDLSRCHAYGALTLVPLVYRLISLAGPGPSGSTRPSRLCQRCFPPSPASPGSGCAQLLPGCCDNLARRSRTSFDSQRLTAHQRLVAHSSSGTCSPTPPSATTTSAPATTPAAPTPAARPATTSGSWKHSGTPSPSPQPPDPYHLMQTLTADHWPGSAAAHPQDPIFGSGCGPGPRGGIRRSSVRRSRSCGASRRCTARSGSRRQRGPRRTRW